VNVSQYEELFKKDIAVGHSNIQTDSIDFRFKDEHFSLPTVSTIGIATFNGYFYTGKVKKLRALLKEIEDARGEKQSG